MAKSSSYYRLLLRYRAAHPLPSITGAPAPAGAEASPSAKAPDASSSSINHGSAKTGTSRHSNRKQSSTGAPASAGAKASNRN